jgi:hypothetical protein
MITKGKIMNYDDNNKQSSDSAFLGYQFIIDDIEEKYIYLTLKGGERRETPREELIEIIKSGKPVPILEVRKRN